MMEFDLRGRPAIEIRYGGRVPKEIKEHLRLIIGKEREQPTEKRRITSSSKRKGSNFYRVTDKEIKVLRKYVHNNDVRWLSEELEISVKQCNFILIERREVRHDVKQKILRFIKRAEEGTIL
jgi:hypothetical protein